MRRAIATAIAATVAVLAGCGGSGDKRAGPSPRPPEAPEPTVTATAAPDAERIRDLLARRAAALHRGRPAAYARTSAGPRRADDRLAARRAAALGVRDVDFSVQDVDVRGRRAVVRVRRAYRVRGVRGRFGRLTTLRARRAGGVWRVSGKLPSRGRAPWEVDVGVRLTTRHFVVWLPDGSDAQPLLLALEDGYARMREALEPGSLRRRYLVVVARDPRAARQITGRIDGLGGLTALTDTAVRQTGPAKRVVDVASQRLLVVWSNFVAIDAGAQRIAVSHELTHAALAPVTSGRIPAWLSEGVAMYVSGDRRSMEAATFFDRAVAGSPRVRRALRLGALSRPDAIGRLAGDAQRAAYALSSSAAHYVADRFGRAKLLELYEAFNSPRLRGRAGDPALTDAATRRVLGIPLRRLERALRSSLDLAVPFATPAGP